MSESGPQNPSSGESTISEAGDRAGVDGSTVMKLRLVAEQGA